MQPGVMRASDAGLDSAVPASIFHLHGPSADLWLHVDEAKRGNCCSMARGCVRDEGLPTGTQWRVRLASMATVESAAFNPAGR